MLIFTIIIELQHRSQNKWKGLKSDNIVEAKLFDPIESLTRMEAKLGFKGNRTGCTSFEEHLTTFVT